MSSISLRGCGFHLKNDSVLSEKTSFFCRLQITGHDQPIRLRGRLLYCIPKKYRDKTTYYCGLEFGSASEEKLKPMIDHIAHIGLKTSLSEKDRPVLHYLAKDLEATLSELRGLKPPFDEKSLKKKAGSASHLFSAYQLLAKGQLQASDIEPLNLSHVLDEALELMDTNLDPDALVVDWKTAPSLIGNAALLAATLKELIENARRAISFRKNGRIEVGCSHRSNGSIEVYVQDNGRGVDSAMREVIFKPGFSEFREFIGIGKGMGLAFVRRALALHDATIHVEDHSEEGCRFVIQFSPMSSSGARLSEV